MNRPPSESEPIPPNWRGSGTVLIVDDEEMVRLAATQMIGFFGFQVWPADSGPQALDLLRADNRPVDLVLLDLTMPGMDGFATFTAIRQLRPGQPIVVFSGYSAQDARARFAGQSLDGFLSKPFTVDSLRKILHQFSRK
jgi:two-component system cell cycle sensor histidine kinase/response regulator CckA